MRRSLLLTNARIFCNGAIDAKRNAVAVDGDRIAAVGTTDELRSAAGENAEVCDVGGRLLLPGFVDAHVHFEMTSLAFISRYDCRTPPNKSIDDIKATLAKAVPATPSGRWIIGQGTLFQEHRLREGRYPTAKELDDVSTEHPIMVRFSVHVMSFNSAALKILDVARFTEDPPGAAIDRDPITGAPTGVTRDLGPYLQIPRTSREELRDVLLKSARELFLANGVTSVQEISETLTGLELMSGFSAEEFPLCVKVYVQIPGTATLDEALSREFQDRYFGPSSRLRFGGIKIFLDGGISSMAAAMNEPYVRPPHGRGRLGYEREQITEIINRCVDAGVQLCTHATGDWAQDTVLDAYAASRYPAQGRSLRHRVEHAGNLLCTDARLDRYLSMDVIPVPNPQFLHTFGDFIPDVLGEERARNSFRIKSLLERGVKVAGNSDCSGTERKYLDPLHCIWVAGARKTFAGNTIGLDEAISPEQGLTNHTAHAAYAGRDETSMGGIAPGMRADFVVLDICDGVGKLEDYRTMRPWRVIAGGVTA
jgi:hypothetical protein